MKKRQSERGAEARLHERYRIKRGRLLSVADYAWMVRFTEYAVHQALERIPFERTQTGRRIRIIPTPAVNAFIRERKSDDPEDYEDFMRVNSGAMGSLRERDSHCYSVR